MKAPKEKRSAQLHILISEQEMDKIRERMTQTGITNTSAFIRNIRLKAACRIMEEKGSSVRVSDLAYAVGFNDPKYFSSCFKKEFGMLPTEYQERFIQS